MRAYARGYSEWKASRRRAVSLLAPFVSVLAALTLAVCLTPESAPISPSLGTQPSTEATSIKPAPPPVPPAHIPTSYPVLEAAVVAMRSVASFHFVENSKNGVSIAFPQVETFEATGEYQSPDRFRKRGVVTYGHLPTTENVQVIGIGSDQNVANPDTGEWERSSESIWGTHELYINPISITEDVVSLLGPNAYRGISTLGGVRVHRFVYSTPDLKRSGTTIEPFDAVIVVGVDDSLVREVKSKLSRRKRPCPPPDQACPAIEIMPGWSEHSVTFSYPDEPVIIQAPVSDVSTPQPSGMFAGFHSISAKELARAYLTDPTTADAMYRGEDLSVVGRVHSVTHLYPGSAFVLLGGHAHMSIGCFPGAWGDYRALRGPVTMFGVGEGLTYPMGANGGVVSLTHCEVVRQGEPTPTGRPSPKPTP